MPSNLRSTTRECGWSTLHVLPRVTHSCSIADSVINRTEFGYVKKPKVAFYDAVRCLAIESQRSSLTTGYTWSLPVT